MVWGIAPWLAPPTDPAIARSRLWITECKMSAAAVRCNLVTFCRAKLVYSISISSRYICCWSLFVSLDHTLRAGANSPTLRAQITPINPRLRVSSPSAVPQAAPAIPPRQATKVATNIHCAVVDQLPMMAGRTKRKRKKVPAVIIDTSTAVAYQLLVSAKRVATTTLNAFSSEMPSQGIVAAEGGKRNQ